MPIPSSEVKHIIGQVFHTLHKLESFSRVFALVANTKVGNLFPLVGRRHICLLAEFVVEMLIPSH